METIVKKKNLGIFSWIVVGIIAIILWPVTFAFLIFLVGKYIYNNYIINPSTGLSEIQEILEANQKQYVEILAKYNGNETPSSMSAFIKEIMETDAQLINQIRSTKIKERFNKKKLRELSAYISDYVKLQTKLVDSPDWQDDDSDYKKNTNYLEMQEILKAIS